MAHRKHTPLQRSSTPTPRVIEVAAGLVFHKGKLLITQRHADAHLGGLWEFPGGKREPDETFEQCLERELMEELDVCVCVGELFESVTHKYPEKTVHLKFFLCEIKKGDPKPFGCNAIKWVDATALTKHEFPAADARLLEKLHDRDLWFRS